MTDNDGVTEQGRSYRYAVPRTGAKERDEDLRIGGNI
jgi:hypothetical protein